MAAFDEHLTALVARTYAEVGVASVNEGFGVLSRHFSSNARKRPLSDLLRERLPNALQEARVPVKRQSPRYRETETTKELVHMLEAERIVGVSRDRLATLEGNSPTFLARSKGRGGTVLFSAAGLQALKRALDNSVSLPEAARALGIPNHVVPQFIADGLLDGTANLDARILFGPAQRIVTTSVEHLAAKLRELPAINATDGVPLGQGLAGRVHPKTWSTATRSLLDRRVVQTMRSDGSGLPLADMHVQRDDLAILNAVAPTTRLTGSVSCLEAAAALGTTGQFVAAAVSSGLIDGEVRRGRSAVCLDSVRAFHAAYILSSEIAARLGCRLHQVRRTMLADDQTPVHTVYRVNVWCRSDVEQFLCWESIGRKALHK